MPPFFAIMNATSLVYLEKQVIWAPKLTFSRSKKNHPPYCVKASLILELKTIVTYKRALPFRYGRAQAG